jgi:hypothetical protein
VAGGPQALANLAAQSGVGVPVTSQPGSSPGGEVAPIGTGSTTVGTSGGTVTSGGNLGPVEAPRPRPTGDSTKPAPTPNPR